MTSSSEQLSIDYNNDMGMFLFACCFTIVSDKILQAILLNQGKEPVITSCLDDLDNLFNNCAKNEFIRNFTKNKLGLIKRLMSVVMSNGNNLGEQNFHQFIDSY